MEERAATRFKNESVATHQQFQPTCQDINATGEAKKKGCYDRLHHQEISDFLQAGDHCLWIQRVIDWGNDGKLIFKDIVWSFLKDFYKRKYKHVDIDVARILLHFPVAFVHFVQWYGGECLIRAIPKLPWQLAKVSNECCDLITAADVFGYVAWHEKMMTVTTWIIQSEECCFDFSFYGFPASNEASQLFVIGSELLETNDHNNKNPNDDHPLSIDFWTI